MGEWKNVLVIIGKVLSLLVVSVDPDIRLMWGGVEGCLSFCMVLCVGCLGVTALHVYRISYLG